MGVAYKVYFHLKKSKSFMGGKVVFPCLCNLVTPLILVHPSHRFSSTLQMFVAITNTPVCVEKVNLFTSAPHSEQSPIQGSRMVLAPLGILPRAMRIQRQH